LLNRVIPALIFFLAFFPPKHGIDVGFFYLRLHDLASVVIFLLMLARINSYYLYFSKYQKALNILIIYIGISSIVGYTLWGNITSLFMPFRLFQYSLFGFFALVTLQTMSGWKWWISVFALYVFMLSLLQAFEIIPGISDVYGIRYDMARNVIANTGGPWELAPLVSILSIFFIRNFDLTRSQRIIVFIVATILVIMTASRSGALAHLLLGIYLFPVIAFFTSIVLLSLLLLINFSEVSIYLVQRSAKLFEFKESLSYLKYLYEHAPTDPTLFNQYDGWNHNELRSFDIDASLRARLTKWITAFKSWVDSPLSIIFGLGAGVFGRSLDGGLLRIVTELGLVGTFLFLHYLRELTRRGMFPYVIVLVVNMISIDTYMAAYFMSFFIFLTTIEKKMREN